MNYNICSWWALRALCKHEPGSSSGGKTAWDSDKDLLSDYDSESGFANSQLGAHAFKPPTDPEEADAWNRTLKDWSEILSHPVISVWFGLVNYIHGWAVRQEVH